MHFVFSDEDLSVLANEMGLGDVGTDGNFSSAVDDKHGPVIQASATGSTLEVMKEESQATPEQSKALKKKVVAAGL